MTNSERIQANNAELREAIEMAESLPDAIEVTKPIIEPLSVTENGTYTAPSGVDGYSPIEVDVPIPDGYIIPSGTKSITENGTHDVTKYASVEVDVATSGGGDVEEKQIIFIDYDGTVLYSYTPEEALALTELPQHESTDELLIFDGWNWTLEDLKAEINLIGLDFMQHHKMAVGATYNTIDDATYLFIDIDSDYEENRKAIISVCPSPRKTVTIDWGDGSEPSTITSTSSYMDRLFQTSHIYAKGSYVMRLYSEDTFMLGDYILRDPGKGRPAYIASALKKAYIGKCQRGFWQESFYSCNNLSKISFPNTNGFSAKEDTPFVKCSSLKALVIGRGTTTMAQCIQECNGIEKVSLPYSLRSIKGTASDTTFAAHNSIRVLHVPLKTTIDTNSFGALGYESAVMRMASEQTTAGGFLSAQVNLKRAKIIGEIQSLPNSCFSGNVKMEKVYLPLGIQSLGEYCFKNNESLCELELPETITSMGSSCFQNCYTLKTIKIPSAVTDISSSMFYGCSALTSVDMPDGVTSIGSSVFSNCSALTSVDMPDGVTSIGSSAFRSCTSLASINIPNTVTSISDSTFNGCSALTSVDMPDGATSIGSNAFASCSKLTNISIPSGVTKINTYAFYCCYLLEYIDLTAYGTDKAFPTLGGTNALSFCGTKTASGTFEIRVPAGRGAELAAMTNWSTYADKIVEV